MQRKLDKQIYCGGQHKINFGDRKKLLVFFGGSLTVNELRFGRIRCWMNCNWVLSGNCERYIHVYSEHWMVMSILGKIIIVLDFLYLPVNHLIV